MQQNSTNNTILIIEDNELNRDMLEVILSDEYSLLLAENGLIGMEMLREHYKDIDIVLLDIEMPVMNGYEVLEKKANDMLTKDIPVIVTTSNDGQDDEMRCLELGACDFVRKPFDPVLVRLRIKNIISLRESTESNLQKAIFIQNINHEMRTPMNAIMGVSQLLTMMDEELDAKERLSYFNMITNSSLTLMCMIDNMITLSDIDCGSFKISKSEVSINDICRNAMSATEYCIPEGVTVSFSSDVEDSLMVSTDSKQAQKALVNFLSNAGKFTASGDINVHCSVDKVKDIISISVADTGIGIAKDRAEFIFERFAKIDDFVPGNGLGLCVSRTIATELGGKAYLDTTYESGARFVLELPLKP